MSRKETHKKEMEEFRRSQKQKQKEAAVATAGSALKTTAAALDVTTYRTPGGITPFGLSPGLRIENSILNAKQQEKEYSGFAETFAQKALNEELLGNYPDSRYLWSQAAEMDQKSKEAGAKAAFFREVVQNPAAFYSPPGSAPKPTKPSSDRTTSSTSGTYADRETVQLQIDQLAKEKQDYIRASGGKADDSVLNWYDNQLRDLYSAKSALPTEAKREDILLQTLGGNYYTGRTTLGGTAGQIGIGLLGADLPADIRDLAYDFEHRSSIPKGQIALDALALLPVVGGLKYTDDAVAAAKQAHNLMDTGGDLVYNGAKAAGKIDLKPAALMDELTASGKKYTPQDVIMVTKNSNGDLLWLEQGNPNNGWEHIRTKHGKDFKHSNGKFYTEEEVQALMRQLLNSEPIIKNSNKNGPYAIYAYNGHAYRIGWGDNGYIKSFYPYSKALK